MSVSESKVRPVWVADLGNGTYRNPVLCADYSDPDVIRVGEDFYMTASSFVSTPGLPILHSKDLVNWTLIGHAIDQLPGGYDDSVRHGDGVWAPAIRYHDGKYWIYFSAPDEGIYMTTAEHPAGPWTPLHMVKEVKGWIDPCPFWDEDGQAYLVHAFARSRCGIKSKLQICRMSPDGMALLDDGMIIFDGTDHHPTIEGPKLYKRGGYYYVFAPAGGVAVGWQTVLRAENIWGPYEDKIVLHQGDSPINGPHQGGYVELESGEFWFMHFQDREAYGRIIHLQPMSWENDWPIIGLDTNGDGIGEPALVHKKPDVGREWPCAVPETSDEFDQSGLGLQWQWQANHRPQWYSLTANPGHLRLYAQPLPAGASTLYNAMNILCQKLPAPEFTATVKLTFTPSSSSCTCSGSCSSFDSDSLEELAGLTVFGFEYRYIALKWAGEGLEIVFVEGKGSKEKSCEQVTARVPVAELARTIYFRTVAVEEAVFSFYYSLDGVAYHRIGDEFAAVPGGWVGAKLGLFCLQDKQADAWASQGFVDIDWFRFNDEKEGASV